MTKIIDACNINIEEIVNVLKFGGVIAIPTDTVYGLACDFFNIDAVSRIYEIKGRPEDMPLIAMVADVKNIDSVAVNLTPDVKVLAYRFWPGPLTMILDAKPTIPKIAIANGTTVGVRIPDHEITLQILDRYSPLATTSANLSGWSAPDNAGDVIAHLDGRVDIIIDGGLTNSGIASTILNCTTKPFHILREGTVKSSNIVEVLKEERKSFIYDEEQGYTQID